MFDLLIHYPVIMKTIYIPEAGAFSWRADTGIIDAGGYRSYVLLIGHYDPYYPFPLPGIFAWVILKHVYSML